MMLRIGAGMRPLPSDEDRSLAEELTDADGAMFQDADGQIITDTAIA